MKLLLSVLSLLSATWALSDRFELVEEKNVVPPGKTDIALNFLDFDNNNLVLVANVSVGSDNQTVPFMMVSTMPDIVISNNTDYDPLISLTYVPVNGIGPVTIQNVTLNNYTIYGQEGYELFNFSNLYTHGQGFLLANTSTNVSRMGFSFNKSDSLGYPMFLDKLYQEAQITHRIISFATQLFADKPYFNGYMNLGYINELAFDGELTNYSVTVDNGNWAFHLTDMSFGNVGLGYNGFVTINTNSPGNFVPDPVRKAIVELIGLPSMEYQQGNALYSAYLCSSLDFDTLPNVTYYLDNKPLVLTPTQYIINYQDTLGFCILSFGGSAGVDPIRSAFTLGTIMMNNSYTVFDFEQKTFGIAPLLPLLE